MRNPFTKHSSEHDSIYVVLCELTYALDDLRKSVKELREEVDYLVDYLDD